MINDLPQETERINGVGPLKCDTVVAYAFIDGEFAAEFVPGFAPEFVGVWDWIHAHIFDVT